MGNVTGIREGTVAAAVLTGFVVNCFVHKMGGARPPLKAGGNK